MSVVTSVTDLKPFIPYTIHYRGDLNPTRTMIVATCSERRVLAGRIKFDTEPFMLLEPPSKEKWSGNIYEMIHVISLKREIMGYVHFHNTASLYNFKEMVNSDESQV